MALNSKRTVALGKTRDHHIFKNGKIAENLRSLKDPADAHLVDFMGFASQQRLALELDRSRIGNQLADQAVEKRRFACAIGADNGMNRTFFNAQIDIAQGLQSAEAFADILDFKNTHLILKFLITAGRDGLFRR